MPPRSRGRPWATSSRRVPGATCGEAEGLFGTAKDLLSGRSLGKVGALYLALEREALALRTFGDDNVVVARAPLNARRALFNALEDAPLSEDGR